MQPHAAKQSYGVSMTIARLIKKGPFWGPPSGYLKPNYQVVPGEPKAPNGSDQPNE